MYTPFVPSLDKLFVLPPAVFLLHTDSDALNFANEFLAFTTGQIARNGLGADQQQSFVESRPPADIVSWLAANIFRLADETRMVSGAILAPTPGYFNDGRGNFWPDNADPLQVSAKFAKTAIEYYGHWIADFEYRDNLSGNTRLNAEADRFRDALVADVAAGPGKYPAYLSAGVMFSSVPPQNVIDFLKARASAFVLANAPMKFGGFALVVPPTTPWTFQSL